MPLRLPLALAALLATACGGAPKRPDLVLVTVDTLRWDHVGAYGGKSPTPNLDGIAASGTRFDVATTVAPVTLVAHGSLLTGRYPFHHGVRSNGFYRLEPDAVTLAERLAAEGYATAAFVSGFPLESRFGTHQGFATYDDAFTRVEGGGSAYEAERTASETLGAALPWLAKARSPFFLWIHLYDPHAEYEAPAPWNAAPLPYDGEIAYTDAELGKLRSALEARGPDRTLLVVAGDHGESLGEHGERTHTIFVYDATIRVPLLVSGAGVARGHVAREPVSLVDVAPTVLDWLGMAPGDVDGVSLAGALRGGAAPSGRALYFESYVPRLEFGWSPLVGVRRGDLKLIRAPQPELYDLGADPGELASIASSAPERMRELERALDAMVEGGVGRESRAELDEEALATLRSLGYVEGGAPATPLSSVTAELPDPKEMIRDQPKVDNAIRLVNHGRYAEAVELLGPVLARDPGNAFATQILSSAHVRLGEIDAALAVLRAGAARSDGPTQAALRATAGDLLRRTGDLEGSARELRLALASDPGNVQALDILALTELARGRPDESAKLMKLALRISPGHARSLCVLGETALARGDAAEAARRFEEATADASVRPRALLGLALLASASGDGPSRSKHLTALAATDPELAIDAETFQRGGTLAAEAGDLDTAVSLLGRAADAAPGSASIRRDLGVALSRGGKLDLALAALREAARLAPDDAATVNALGTAHARAGQMADAIRAFERALELDPANDAARENLAAARAAAAELPE